MTKKSNFLKKLLTTVSVLTITASAGNAFAENQARLVTGEATQAGVNMDKPAADDVPTGNGDTVTIKNNGSFTATGGATEYAAFKIDNDANTNLSFANNTKIGSITGNNQAILAINSGATITLTGTSTAEKDYIQDTKDSSKAGNPVDWSFASAANDYSGLKEVTFSNENDTLNIEGEVKLETNFTSEANEKGKLIIQNDLENKGSIGTAEKILGEVSIDEGVSLTLIKDEGGIHVKNITSETESATTLNLQGSNFSINANIGEKSGTGTGKFGSVILNGNADSTGAATFKLMQGKTIYGDISLTKQDVPNGNDLDNILELEDGTKISGKIKTRHDKKGIVSVKGESTIGSIEQRDGDKLINKLEIDTKKTLTVTGNKIDTTNGIHFKQDGTLALTGTSATDGFTFGEAITTESDGTGNITLGVGKTIFNAAVGAEGKSLNEVTVQDGSKLTIEKDFWANIATSEKNKGEVVLGATKGNVKSLGTADKQLGKVAFSNDYTIHGKTYVQLLATEADKIVNFKDSVYSEGDESGIFVGGGSTVNFHGAELKSKIHADNSNSGIVNIHVNEKGTTTITKNIGVEDLLAEVNFKGQGNVILKGDMSEIVAKDLKIDGQTLKVAKDITFAANTTITDATIDLTDNKTLTFANGESATLSGNITLNSILNEQNKTLTSVVLADGTTLKTTASTKLVVKVAGTPAVGTKYAIITEKQGTTIPQGKITIKPEGFGKFSQIKETMYALYENNATEEITKAFKDSHLLPDALKYANPANTGDAAKFTDNLATLSDEDMRKSVASLETTTVHAQQVTRNILDSANSIIADRTLNLHHDATGVASGDCDTDYGIWASPFYSSATQKKINNISGFKSTGYGITIGADTKANADLSVGIAGTYVKTDMKHKDAKSGDKTKINSFLFSVYGVQQLTDQCFLEGQASFASSKTKNTESRLNGKEKAKASFDTTAYNGQLLAGFKNKIDNVSVTPLVGASFTRINSAGYKETGTSATNLAVHSKATNKFEAILGLRAKMTTIMDDMNITPEIHTFAKYDLIGKKGTISRTHSGLVDQLSNQSAHAHRATYNIGTGVNITSGMYEFGVGYDLDLAEKYVSHKGTLNVRVNF